MRGWHHGSILASHLIQNSPHSIINNRYSHVSETFSCFSGQSTCLCFLVRRSRFIHENWPEWWEQELSQQRPSNTHKNWEGIRQADGNIWSGPANPQVFTLWRAQGKRKQRRHDTRCFPHLPRHPRTTHIDAHTRRHQSFWMKTWVWTKVWSVRPCCVAGKQRALMRHLCICRVPACGLVNGSK